VRGLFNGLPRDEDCDSFSCWGNEDCFDDFGFVGFDAFGDFDGADDLDFGAFCFSVFLGWEFLKLNTSNRISTMAKE